MKKGKIRRIMAAVLGSVLLMQSGFSTAFVFPSLESYAYTEKTGVVNASSLNVRSGPGTTYKSVGRVSHGTSVTVVGEKSASDGALWYEIRYPGTGGAYKTGYVLASYIRFETIHAADDASFEAYMTSQGFPESYKNALRGLHKAYPNWIFKAQHVNVDWASAVENESTVGKNLVGINSPSSWKSIQSGAFDWGGNYWPGFDGASWVAASKEITAYYMDPRNFLDEKYVFQFLLQSYNPQNQTEDGLRYMLKGTFMDEAFQNTAGGSDSSDPSGNTGTQTSPGGSDAKGPGSVVNDGNNSNGSGNSGVIIAPGSSDSSNTSGSSGTGSSSGNVTIAPGQQPSGPPQGSQDDNVQLQAPTASITQRDGNRVMAPATGPGMNLGDGNGDNTTVIISPGTSASGGNSGSSDTGSGKTDASGLADYAAVIMKAAQESQVNPYVLAAMILQEQGKGTSPLISGKHSKYPGYYNFFNIGAYQDGATSAIERGLWYASQSGSYGRPWNTAEKAIVGGASYYGSSYVNVGQDTFYLKKFNVQGSNMYNHQYMKNVEGAAGEGANLSAAYTSDMKTLPLEFKIPVYRNMPENAAAKPVIDGNPNNKLSSLSVTGYTLTPTFNRDTTSYDLIVDPSVSQVGVSAKAIDSGASVSGTGTIQLSSGINVITVTVKAKNGDIREYKINVVRQNGAPNINSSADETNHGGTVITDPESGNATSGATGPGAVPDSGTGNHSNIIIISPQ